MTDKHGTELLSHIYDVNGDRLQVGYRILSNSLKGEAKVVELRSPTIVVVEDSQGKRQELHVRLTQVRRAPLPDPNAANKRTTSQRYGV